MSKTPNARNIVKAYMDSRKPTAYYPEGDTFDIPNHSGILGNKDAKEELDARYVNVTGDTMTGTLTVNVASGTNPALIVDWDDTGANIDRAFSIRKEGVEQVYFGELFNAYTGMINPNVNGGTLFFGLTNDAFTDVDSVFLVTATQAAVIGEDEILFQIGFGVTEATLTADTLTFEQGATDASIGWQTAGELKLTNAHWSIETVGKGIDIKEGTNARMGTATLDAGTVTVSTTAVAANSRIFIQGMGAADGATQGVLNYDNIVAGTSFDIVSTLDTDSRDVAWIIFNPA